MFDSLRVPPLSSQTLKHKPSKGDSSLPFLAEINLESNRFSHINCVSLWILDDTLVVSMRPFYCDMLLDD
ncbi:hypothetical protein NC651_036073 [Populus alba x Populus x berolinensis]|nr:hypothetical protein NC651_036073 [Populus alba x Populus x berolinensis]